MRVVLLEPLGVAKRKSFHGGKIEGLGHDFIMYDDRPDTQDELVRGR